MAISLHAQVVTDRNGDVVIHFLQLLTLRDYKIYHTGDISKLLLIR